MRGEVSLEIGQRIAEARKRLKMKQEVLAEKAGFSSHQIISQIETGKRDVKAWELSTLARVLCVEMSDLLKSEESKQHPLVLWRQQPLDDIETIEANFLRRCEQYGRVEQLCGKKNKDEIPQISINPSTICYRDAERIAYDIRSQMRLGARPASAIERALEELWNVKIWYMPLEDGSAASTIGDFGPAILMNENEAPWRRNSNFAHELFHLITWDSLPPQELQEDEELWLRIEKIAQAFASYLLLPAEEVSWAFNDRLDPEDGAIWIYDLIEIAREFDVSTEMLLYKLQNLRLFSQETVKELLDDPEFREADRKTMPAHWWDPLEFPQRFVNLAFTAYKKGNLSRGKLAEYLNTNIVELDDVLLRYGIDDSEIYDAKIQADSGPT
jgi:Zn-dependent peptidase ImmA (M78 family)/DNA-binding XRE family transcriptional regulator